MTPQEIFKKKIDELIKKAQDMEEAEVKRVLAMLESARKEVAAQVASTPWQAHHLAELKQAVDRAIVDFRVQWSAAISDHLTASWAHGIDMVDLPLREIGIFAAIPEIDTTALSIMQDFSADLVNGLTDEAKKKINNELTLAFMGQKTPYEAMEAIGRNLEDKNIFTNISKRSETITRNEGNRVLEAASQARKKKASKVVTGLKKQWKHSFFGIKEPRPSHVMAHDQIRDVDEPFDVGGEELMQPLDPAGSAENTINCHCYSVPYIPDWEAAGVAG